MAGGFERGGYCYLEIAPRAPDACRGNCSVALPPSGVALTIHSMVDNDYFCGMLGGGESVTISVSGQPWQWDDGSYFYFEYWNMPPGGANCAVMQESSFCYWQEDMGPLFCSEMYVARCICQDQLDDNLIYCDGYASTDHEYVCSGEGLCISNETCECNPCCPMCGGPPKCYGYDAGHPNVCNGHGWCMATDTCSCQSAYAPRSGTSADCSELITCNGINFNDTSNVCGGSSHGDCLLVNISSSIGQCNCYSEYERWDPIGCEVAPWDCSGLLTDDWGQCGGNGLCVGQDNCSCRAGFFDWNTNCDNFTCGPSDCNGHGTCTDWGCMMCDFYQLEYPGCCDGDVPWCSCQAGWQSPDCSVARECFGIPFYDPSVCNSHGDCDGTNWCNCWQFYAPESGGSDSCSEVFQCAGIPANETSQVCGGPSFGTCYYDFDTIGHCECTSQAITNLNSVDCIVNWTCNGGTDAWNQAACGDNGICSSQDTCTCRSGYLGTDSGCVAECSGHGTMPSPTSCGCDIDWWMFPDCCNNPGCECDEGWGGPDCSVELICDGLSGWDANVCNGMGECLMGDWCNCDHSCYMDFSYCLPSGPFACDLFCPEDPAACSGMGTCVAAETCSCWSNHTGQFCADKIQCSGIPFDSIDPRPCHGRGDCVAIDTCSCWDEQMTLDDEACLPITCGSVPYDAIDSVCSGHGDCVAPDVCVCAEKWDEKDDCSVEKASLTPAGTVVIAVTLPLATIIVIAVAAVVVAFIVCCPAMLCSCCCCLIKANETAGEIAVKRQESRTIELAEVEEGTPANDEPVKKKPTTKKPSKKASSSKRTSSKRGSQGGKKSVETEETEDDGERRASFRMHQRLLEIPYDNVRLIDTLGTGGGGASVFLASWNGERVAFKVFKIRHLGQESTLNFEEFERELEIMSSVSHPNILRLFGCSLDPPRVGLVMELCEHGDLVDVVYKNLVPGLQGRMTILRGVVSGMTYLHDRHIIHRDLKPQNILLDSLMCPKIMDFGLSRLKSESSKDMTMRIGTNTFMAPELTLSTAAGYDEAVDVYAFAILMWEFVEKDFEPYKDAELMGIERRIAADPEFRPAVPPEKYDGVEWIGALMNSCWRHEPTERPSFAKIRETMDAHLTELEEFDSIRFDGKLNQGDEEDKDKDEEVVEEKDESTSSSDDE